MGKLKDIDEDEVRELAKIGCTYEEMAGVLRCNKDTLTSRFKDIIHEGWEEGKRSIRRKQKLPSPTWISEFSSLLRSLVCT